MSYKTPTDPDILRDVAHRKEFYQYYQPDREIDRSNLKFLLERLQKEALHLDLSSYQALVTRLMDPRSPFARLLLKWGPGMGKTIGGISIAMLFAHLFDREVELDESANVGWITIIGFTDEGFKKELLSYPKYGFVTREDLRQQDKLVSDAFAGGAVEQERLTDFNNKLRKRLSSRRNGGHFRFYGYKAFVNRIFELHDSKHNINEMSEDEIRRALSDGSLKWNVPLLESFRGGMLICDEIHDTYNSLEKNNWGIAIQMVLDRMPSLKTVFMSATPLNNSPTEIIDLCNLLNPPTARITRADLFTSDRVLLPGALKRIAELVRGKISFIQDANIEQFATQEIVGEEIAGIPYLKFHRVPMSPFHYNTYRQVYEGTLAQDSQYLLDFALPNPSAPEMGIYKTSDIKRHLSYVDDKWVAENGFRYRDELLVGPGFDESRIGRYSAKYAELLRLIRETLRPDGGKVFIYHNIVHISGVLFIEQLLQQNGYIAPDQGETANTICAICGAPKSEHSEPSGGDLPDEYKPVALEKLTEIQRMEFAELMQHQEVLPESYAVFDRHGLVCIAGVEYHNGELVAITVRTDHRRRGIGRNLIRATAKPGCLVRVPVEQPELLEFFTKCGFREHARETRDIVLTLEIDGGRPYHIVALADATPDIRRSAATLADRKDADWAPGTWFAMAGPAFAGVIEWIDNGPLSARLQTLATHPSHRDAARRLIDGTRPPVQILRDVSKTDDVKFWQDAGFRIAGEDDRYWYVEGGAVTRPARPATRSTRPAARPQDQPVHKFSAARYVMAHSDLDKTIMHRNIDRFNSPDNTYGYIYKFIIGSKIIRQSYNFKAIRHQFLMSRPDNLSILIQILGRALRRGSHNLLPPHMRNIAVRLITSCLPVKERGAYKLSHEEMRYGEKVQDYMVIQQIEKVMHEQAIDGAISRPIIESALRHDSMGALWYQPATVIPARGFRSADINMSTFDVFHTDDEINSIIFIIKRLYIERSLVWRYEELWRAVQNPPFQTQMNTRLFAEDNFIIALDMMVYKHDDARYVKPHQVESGPVDSMNLLDVLYSGIDKRVIMPNNSVGNIHAIGGRYIYIPVRGGSHVISTESPFRYPVMFKARAINILRYLRDSSTSANYDTRKQKFRLKYQKVPLEKLASVIGKFGAQFHSQFIEEIIKYVFNIWTNPSVTEKSEFHDFYFKMLYFYDLMRLVIWGSTVKEIVYKMYQPYMLAESKAVDHKEVDSISRSHTAESLRVSRTEFYRSLKLSAQILKTRNTAPAADRIVRADPSLLPIGHFTGQVPRFYHPEKDWFENPEYVQRTQEYRENDIIVGYYEKSAAGLRIRFKIRTPIHMIKRHKDIRLVEKGSICSSYSKVQLTELATLLGITKLSINVPNLCAAIEQQLIINEMEERRKKSNIKWFYSFWETRPDERRHGSSSGMSTQ